MPNKLFALEDKIMSPCYLFDADNVAIIPPSLNGLKHMLKLCERIAVDHDIKFNPSKSNSVCYNVKHVEKNTFIWCYLIL